MKDIIINAHDDTPFMPEVSFHAATGICSIEGESYLEDSLTFYTPLLNWILQYDKEHKGSLKFSIKLSYFNTSSSRCLLDILRLLKEIREQGKEVLAIWYYPSSDPDSLMDGEDFMKESGLTMDFIEYED